MPWTKVAIDDAGGNLSEEIYGRGDRELSFSGALLEAHDQALSRDKRVFVMGEGVDDVGGIFGSTLNLHKKFGDRVFDAPLSENGLTGFCVGAALAGSRPVLVHMRMDFLLLSIDQIFNHAAKLSYMTGGRVCVPLVIRCIIGKGWGSAAQHSQALHALFLHMPGIKVVMPSSAYDAKGLFFASIADNNPVVFIEHRWLYDKKSFVPEDEYIIPFGKGVVRRFGKDVTIIGLSMMLDESLAAWSKLKDLNINAEIIDLRSLVPLDEELIVESVKKTGRLVIADLGWRSGGAAEIIFGRVFNKIRHFLKADVKIVSSPDSPTPASPALEVCFYKNSDDIVREVKEIM